ncbi:MAG: hypothetical protein OXM01_04455 [Gemmatimonadota bacterium]|nr:hypothetical protein [Gemmatimonadota bacterium]
MKRLLKWGVPLIVVSMPNFCLAQNSNAYRLQGDAILVDRASLWGNWIYQNDLVTSLNVPVREADIFQVGTDGLRPVFFRRNINVGPTARDFTYPDLVRAAGALTSGGATAKSNDALANNILDNDLSTFWEPDTPASFERRLSDSGDFHLDGISNWELEIDLGRLVFADSLTIIFPGGQFEDEFLGQPGKALALFASMGERFPFPLGNNLQFTLVEEVSTGFVAGKLAQCVRDESVGFAGETRCEGGGGVETGEVTLVSVPGTEGRYVQMTFPLVPLDRADWDLDGLPDIGGAFIQYVRVKITDSDLWRDSFLGEGEDARLAYEALPEEQRGALVYQRQTAGGLLVEIQGDANQTAREKYQTLPEEKRGPILYYVKEVPRISEIQIWAKGDNYALQPEQRGGASFEHGGLGAPDLATDGLYDSQWTANTWSPVYVKGTAWYDLGAVFWVDNLSVVNKRINQSHLGAFLGPGILVSDGTLLKPLSMKDREDFTQLEEGLKWDNIISEEHIDNHTPVVRIFQEAFALRKIRFLQVRDIDVTGHQSGRYGALATMAEIQLYGEGYPVSVWAYSPPISLTDSRGNFIRKTLPRIAWEGDVLIRDVDPLTGQFIERIEPLDLHPDVRLQVQTRTSDQTDTNFTYYQVVSIGGKEEREEVSKNVYDEIALQWLAWEIWQTLPSNERHASRKDDDGDGANDEDPIDLIDNDGDGLIDEDGKKLRRAPRSSFAKDGELAFVGWSAWSESYLPTNGVNEATITSPNPRKFVQVRVNISSEDPFKTARIRELRIELAPPLALELAGELALVSDDGEAKGLTNLDVLPADYTLPRDINPLKPQRFSYFIRAAAPDPTDATVRDGFNEVLVVTPRAARLTGVRLGQVEVTETSSLLDPDQMQTSAVTTRFDRAFAEDDDGILRAEDGSVLERIAAGEDSIWVRFPFSLNADLPAEAHALIEVQFESQSFREGIEFTSFVRASDSDEGVFQRVDTENRDATELVDSSTTRVSLMALLGSLIQDVVLTPVFTPNGDGINDEFLVHFALLKVLEERPLGVAFYDLGGRLVGRGQSATESGKVGDQTFTWDGRNLDGQIVSPGIYLCRIEVEADDEASQLVRLVHVAY